MKRIRYFKDITESKKDEIMELMKDMSVSELSKKVKVGVGFISKICDERYGKRGRKINNQLKTIKDELESKRMN